MCVGQLVGRWPKAPLCKKPAGPTALGGCADAARGPEPVLLATSAEQNGLGNGLAAGDPQAPDVLRRPCRLLPSRKAVQPQFTPLILAAAAAGCAWWQQHPVSAPCTTVRALPRVLPHCRFRGCDGTRRDATGRDDARQGRARRCHGPLRAHAARARLRRPNGLGYFKPPLEKGGGPWCHTLGPVFCAMRAHKVMVWDPLTSAIYNTVPHSCLCVRPRQQLAHQESFTWKKNGSATICGVHTPYLSLLNF